jgi:protein DGCR14
MYAFARILRDTLSDILPLLDRPLSPTINDFSLVPNMPSPTPSQLGPDAVKQLMTWGTLNATPRIISQSDDPALATPNTPFHLPAPSSRERISHKLSNSASKSLRAKAGLLGLGSLGRTPGITRTPMSVGGSAGRKGNMAPPSWTPRRAEAAESLTPAARRLLDRSTMGTAALRRAEAMSKIARWEGDGTGKETDLTRVRWTPTPSSVTRR